MDDRTFQIIVIVLVGGIGLVLLQPLLTFEIPSGLWTLLGAVMTYLGVREVQRRREDEDG